MILLKWRIIEDGLKEVSADRKCGARTLSEGARAEMDATILAAYPCTYYEFRTYAHKPCIRVVI